MRTLVWRGLDEPRIEKRSSSATPPQRGDRVVHYSSDGFEADIEFDADGFVTLYHDYLERIA